mmetsp:Transcript_32992/g.87054  ORF Transcript_32992/g.87054 Transcript_32992/m.87054 type:complete len:289 (-) Transcript_32992:106-972(-)
MVRQACATRLRGHGQSARSSADIRPSPCLDKSLRMWSWSRRHMLAVGGGSARVRMDDRTRWAITWTAARALRAPEVSAGSASNLTAHGPSGRWCVEHNGLLRRLREVRHRVIHHAHRWCRHHRHQSHPRRHRRSHLPAHFLPCRFRPQSRQIYRRLLHLFPRHQRRDRQPRANRHHRCQTGRHLVRRHLVFRPPWRCPGLLRGGNCGVTCSPLIKRARCQQQKPKPRSSFCLSCTFSVLVPPPWGSSYFCSSGISRGSTSCFELTRYVALQTMITFRHPTSCLLSWET